jgi:uncharacterized membrane protein
MPSGAHLHLILNHLPVVGSFFAFLLLAWGYLRRSDDIKRAALGSAVAVALVTIPTYLTGEPAWEGIMDVPGDNDAFVLAHQRMAQFAFAACALAGLVALIALWRGRGGRLLPAKLSTFVLILLLATTGLTAWVANLGGMIRHTEIRAT